MKKHIALVLALVLLFTSAALSSCGSSALSKQTVCETEDFSVNAAMMAYFFKMQHDSYSSYYSILGIKPDVSLKEQECPLLKTGIGTWFTYFVELTKGHVTEILALCQTAHDNGVELDKEDRANIDSYISDVEGAARANGYSLNDYISKVVGNPMTEKDLRACLELEILAEKYSVIYESSLTYTADEMEAYYAENPAEFSVVDVYAYTVTVEPGKEAETRAAMEQIATAKTPAEYKAFVKAYIEATDKKTGETAAEREERINSEVDACFFRGADQDDFYYSANWAFGAKVGDTYIESMNGTLTAFYLAKAPYRNEAATRDVRHVLFSKNTYKDDKTAKLIYSEWEKAGFSEEKISSIAQEHSDDAVSAVFGGLIKNVIPGTSVAAFDEWIFDADRKEGDHGIIESDIGWHIVYYVGDGELLAWQSLVNDALAANEYNELVSQYIKSIVYNEDAISLIDG